MVIIMQNKKITVAGFGGQGVMMLGQILAHAASDIGMNSLWYPSYGPETRGGTANCSVTLSEGVIYSPVFSKADAIIVLNKPSLDKFATKVVEQGQIFYNASSVENFDAPEYMHIYPIKANDIASELGNIKVANMVMLGAFLAINPIFDDETIIKTLKRALGTKKEDLLNINIQAIEAGKKQVLGDK